MAAIKTPASYELVVDQVRRAIQIGRFLPGEKLPTERELAGQLGVSRMTVREAMCVLQGEGLIETRRGRAGGAVVISAEASPAEQRQLLRRRLAELENVFDYRLAVEPAAASLAAQRRTNADLARLRDAMDTLNALAAGADHSEVSPPSRFFAIDAEFHHRIALATRNPLLIKAVDDARAAMFLPVGGVFTQLHPSANKLHAEIHDAIEAQDAEAAERAMGEHIRMTRDALRDMASGPRRVARPTRARSSARAPSPSRSRG